MRPCSTARRFSAASPAPMGTATTTMGDTGADAAARAAASRHAASRTAAAASAATPAWGAVVETAEHPHAADAETIGAHILPPQQPWGDRASSSLSQSSLTASTRSNLSALFRRRRSWISRSYLYWPALCLVECPGALEVNRSDGQDHTPTAALGSRKSSSSGRTQHLTAARGSRNAGTSRP